jgi:hypothetical protein
LKVPEPVVQTTAGQKDPQLTHKYASSFSRLMIKLFDIAALTTGFDCVVLTVYKLNGF